MVMDMNDSWQDREVIVIPKHSRRDEQRQRIPATTDGQHDRSRLLAMTRSTKTKFDFVNHLMATRSQGETVLAFILSRSTGRHG